MKIDSIEKLQKNLQALKDQLSAAEKRFNRAQDFCAKIESILVEQGLRGNPSPECITEYDVMISCQQEYNDAVADVDYYIGIRDMKLTFKNIAEEVYFDCESP